MKICVNGYDDLNGPTPNYIEIMGTVKLLCEQNLYLAQNQDKEKLLESLQTMMAMTDIVVNQPFLIDYTVSNMIKSLATNNLQDVLSLVAFNETQLRRLQEQFSAMCDPAVLKRAIINERCALITRLDTSINEWTGEYESDIDFGDKLRFYLLTISGIKANDGFQGLNQIDRCLEALELSEHERIDLCKAITEDITQLGPWNYHLQISISAYPSMFESDFRTAGKLRCAETAIAVQRYQLQHGSLPEDLESLVPEFMEAVPADPFDGQSLRYIQHDEGGFTVYSIGEDQIDNGGISEEHMNANGIHGGSHDLTFTIGESIHPKLHIIDDETASEMMMF